MPSRPRRPCLEHGCAALIAPPASRCPEHTAQRNRERHQQLDERRGNAAARGYDYRWATRIRPAQLRREPLCRFCNEAGRVTLATDVDHITPRAEGGSDHPDNLRSLCHACHSRHTARTRGFAQGGGR